jgi:beta-glucosidase
MGKMFGGNNDKKPVLEAYEIGVKEHGEAYIRKRFEESAIRLLTNMIRVGLFENPYIDVEKSKDIVNKNEFAMKAFEAQLKSIILLKNKNKTLPIRQKKKVFIPKYLKPAGINWFGFPVPESLEYPIDLQVVSKYFEIIEEPEDADFGLVFVRNPKTSVGYSNEDVASGGNGIVPISLQYRPYTAIHAREKSIAGERSYKGKTVKTHNECDLDMILDTKKALNGKPIVVLMLLSNPCILSEFESEVDALVVNFGVEPEALLNIISGQAEPSALLPAQMPANMKTVEEQFEDMAHDMKCHVDTEDHVYDFGYGMNWSGVIKDKRTERYSK